MVAAIGPAIYLLCYIYKQDKIEKEPTKMLVQLLRFLRPLLTLIMPIGLTVIRANLSPHGLLEKTKC